MGLNGIPVFLQIADSFSSLISHAGYLAKSILIILLVLSVVSWTIIVEKIRLFRRLSKQSKRFMKEYKECFSLEELAGIADRMDECPEGQLVTALREEMRSGELGDFAYLEKFFESRIVEIISVWESYLIFLATTATISPFLGLLGTVWGIMSSFLSMGVRGSANLFVVGPGIAEALITTIFGLGAAIPAVIGYNYLLRVIRRKDDQLVSFAAGFRNRLAEHRYVELEGGRGRTVGEEELNARIP